MTVDVQSTAPQEQSKTNDKEYNFRALEAKFQRKIDELTTEREQIARELEEAKRSKVSSDDDEDEVEPYVDHKRLKKKLAKFGEESKKEVVQNVRQEVQQALAEERKQNWINQNPDFYEVVQNHVDKLQQKAPQVVDLLLKMPDSFERQQLVYHNIKAMNLDKAPIKESTVQEKIDANRRNYYYQPSNVGSAPYASAGDFSAGGQANAYKKMQELKNSLRLG